MNLTDAVERMHGLINSGAGIELVKLAAATASGDEIDPRMVDEINARVPADQFITAGHIRAAAEAVAQMDLKALCVLG